MEYPGTIRNIHPWCQVVLPTHCGVKKSVQGAMRRCAMMAVCKKCRVMVDSGGVTVSDTAAMFPDMNNNITECCVRVRRLTSLEITKPCRVMIGRQCLPAVDLMLQFHPHPRTVRHRLQNHQLLLKYNEGYQDDVFDTISPIMRKTSLLSDSSNLSEDSFSVTSNTSCGPLLPWPAPSPRSSTPAKTSSLGTYQHWAYVHQRVKVNVKKGKKTIGRKKRLETPVRNVGKNNLSDMVDIIRAEECSRRVEEESGEEVESYFSEYDSIAG
jgi:hypothetical protein